MVSFVPEVNRPGIPSAGARFLFLILLGSVLAPPVGYAALSGSWVGDFSIPAFDGRVTACAILGDTYVVGGDFRWAGRQPAMNVAMWSGTEWTQLGLGLPSMVRKLVVMPNGDLVAATDNHLSGPSPVMRFDGFAWHPVGAGISGEVEAMLVDGSDLYIAGGLYKVGEVWAHRVMRWDGVEWQGVGGSFDSRVMSLAKYQGELYAGGDFLNAGSTFVSRIARWDGSQWNSVGGGTSAGGSEGVAALAEYEDQLIAGGWFQSMGGVENTAGIASWDGSAWRALLNRPTYVTVSDLQAEGGALHVAGVLQETSAWVAGLATFDGSQWTPPATYPDWGIVDVAIGGGALIAVGEFSRLVTATSSHPSRDVVVRDPVWHALNPWQPTMRGLLGPTWTSVWALTGHQGELYAGGYFEYAADPPNWVDRPGLVRWDGARWQSVGSFRGWVHKMLSTGDQLVAAGPFISAGDGASSVLWWNGSAWSDLSHPIQGWVGALTEWQGDVVVGGFLQLPGGAQDVRVAFHRDTGWEELGDLFADSQTAVTDLASFAGHLYVTGGLSLPGTGPRGILRWNGNQWSDLPDSPFGGGADAMLARQDALWVARAPVGVWAWNGTSWTPIPGLSGRVTRMIEVEGTVIAAGWLHVSLDGPTSLAQWDGTRWRAIAGAPVPGIEALASVGRDLWVGGPFTHRGDAPAEAIARWRRDVAPGSASLQMSRPWPMPAGDHVSFRFTLPSEGRVELRVYDLRGGLVAKPIDEWLSVGTHERTWTISASSQAIRPGVYFARLATPRETRGARIVIGPSVSRPAW